MAYNTGNPVPSVDAKDFVDNCENLDKAVNSLDATFQDRLGVTRSTYEGVTQGLSFFNVGTFAVGFTLTNSRQTLTYGGHEYSWSGVFPKAVSAGSTPTPIGSGGWIDRSDVTLRNDLAATDGAKLSLSQVATAYSIPLSSLAVWSPGVTSDPSKFWWYNNRLWRSNSAGHVLESAPIFSTSHLVSYDGRIYAEDFGCAATNAPATNAAYLNNALSYCISEKIKDIFVLSQFTVDDVAVPVRNKTRIFFHGEDVQGLYRRKSLKGTEPSNSRAFDEVPPESLEQFTSASSPIVVMMGDSISGYSVSDCTPTDSMWGVITQHIDDLDASRKFTFVNRGIGGQVWGNANGLPSQFPAWYTNQTKPWLDYIQELNPDLLFLAFGMNDAQGFDAASMHAVLNKINAWAKVPSIVLITTPNPAMSTLYGDGVGFYDKESQEGRDFVAGYTRAVAARYGYGLLDFNRQTNLLRDGRDIISCPMGIQTNFPGTHFISTSPAHSYYFEGGIVNWPDGNSVRFVVGAGTEDWVTVTKSGTALNITARTSGAGNYEVINYTAPSTISSLSLSVTSTEIVVAVDGATEIARFKCLRHGGEFLPRVSYPNVASGPFSGYILSLGYPELVSQSLFDDDIYGTPGVDAGSKHPNGGNGVNHYSSVGIAHIVRPVVRQAKICKKPAIKLSGVITPSPTNIIVQENITAVKVGGVVSVSGVVAVGGVGLQTLICTLPVGFRPKFSQMVTVQKLVGTTWSSSKIFVNANGDMSFYETAPANAVHINVQFSTI